jgi:hypothetical protein
MVEYNLGRVIGTNIAGDAASSIRVFVRDGIRPVDRSAFDLAPMISLPTGAGARVGALFK